MTAYEMRISDWSSDVCSSDLSPRRPTTSPTSGWRSICRRPAATASPRCWPSSATRPSALREHQLVASGGPGPALAAAQRRIPRADGIPPVFDPVVPDGRSEEHTSELQSLMRISYAVFCLKKKTHKRHCVTIHNAASRFYL